MITKVLVANRGEIARRVFASCRRLGVATVAVHSEADAALPFVREADAAVRLPGNTPAETYLRAELMLEAARRTGADAIHPGYGFLSENAAFARAVESAGLTWIGPAPESIEAMGSKIESKRLMAEAGVPVLTAPDQPTDADLPLLVKASAGGGGRGMRIVRRVEDLESEIAAAEAEAASAFGDGTVFVEPYVERGRHVEVQVVGYPEGVLVLGERDCSLQRRHQKVVEEAPAPDLPTETRERLHEAARTAAAAIGYRGAGTVEFLYDRAADRFFFLEMNTRLQVEHPVTEAVFGVDLVGLQLDVAEGATTPPAPTEPSGHAVEVRLYAEDPTADYAPQAGVLHRFEIDHDVAFADLAGPGLRLDSGFESGSEVGTFYDAMLAKVISYAPTRAQAARRLAGALERARLHGVVTNRDQLVRVLRDPRFLAGEVSTAFLGELAPSRAQELDPAALLAAAIAVTETAAERRPVQRGTPIGWRNVFSAPQVVTFRASAGSSSGEDEIPVRWQWTREGAELVHEGDSRSRVVGSAGAADGGRQIEVETDGMRATYDVAIRGAQVDVDWAAGHVALERVPRFTDPASAAAAGSLLAPMPGTILSVAAEAGQQVAAGDRVLVMEAMKMQHTVSAPTDGTVTEINVKEGQQVAAGEVLAVVEESEQG